MHDNALTITQQQQGPLTSLAAGLNALLDALFHSAAAYDFDINFVLQQSADILIDAIGGFVKYGITVMISRSWFHDSPTSFL